MKEQSASGTSIKSLVVVFFSSETVVDRFIEFIVGEYVLSNEEGWSVGSSITSINGVSTLVESLVGSGNGWEVVEGEDGRGVIEDGSSMLWIVGDGEGIVSKIGRWIVWVNLVSWVKFQWVVSLEYDNEGWNQHHKGNNDQDQ